MKPYGRYKVVKGGNTWKIDHHIHPKRKYMNWWEDICDYFSRGRIKQEVNVEIKNQMEQKITRSHSGSLDEHTTAVEDYPGVLGFVCEDVHKSIRLTTYIKDEMTELFGAHNTRFRGEFFYYVWFLDFCGEIFHVFTAKGKGTQFCIQADRDQDKSNVCIRFLGEMDDLFLSLEQNGGTSR